MRTPSTLNDLRRFVASLNWEDMMGQIKQESQSRLAILGPVNAGKSTLFNALRGRNVSSTSAVPGTTRQLVADWFGPFILVDTPGFGEVDGVDRAGIALQGIAHAAVIIFMLDAAAGLRQSDRDLYRRLVATGRPIVVAMNKIDLVASQERALVLADASAHLDGVQVIPISAKRGEGVATQLMPAVFQADPTVTVAVGRALPAYRHMAAHQVVRNAALFNAALGAEPIPIIDLPLLLTSQVRLVLRIAAIYGENISPERARELIATMAGGILLRYLSSEAAKLLPGPGWLLAAAFDSASTFAIGEVAIRYFEGGRQLSGQQMQDIYQQVRQKRSIRSLLRKKPVTDRQ
jgi:small GTP-binding protein